MRATYLLLKKICDTFQNRSLIFRNFFINSFQMNLLKFKTCKYKINKKGKTIKTAFYQKNESEFKYKNCKIKKLK